jgi:hypothetical protein
MISIEGCAPHLTLRSEIRRRHRAASYGQPRLFLDSFSAPISQNAPKPASHHHSTLPSFELLAWPCRDGSDDQTSEPGLSFIYIIVLLNLSPRSFELLDTRLMNLLSFGREEEHERVLRQQLRQSQSHPELL